MTGVYQIVQNPANPTQMYALWDTGRIDPFGGALPIFDGPEWYDWLDGPGRAIHITDWAGPSGYVMDYAGGFHAFGAAPDVGLDVPYYMPGVPYTGVGLRRYIDFSMNPDNSGKGYALDGYGQLYHFGGATACPRAGVLWAQQYAVRLDMKWSGASVVKSVILDVYGGRNQDFPYLELARDGYYDVSRNWVRDQIITDWGTSGPPSGYMLVASGIVYEWGPNAPQDAFGGPYVGSRGTQVTLGLINPADPLDLATGPADPLTLVQVDVGGRQSIYTASTAPTVVAGGLGALPADPTVDTTRPWLMWSYTDPQVDSQTAWQVLVFTQAYVDATTVESAPLNHLSAALVNVSGTDSTTRGVLPTVDLQNGDYRMFVRAQDTSGKWSPWDDRGWTQDVPTPDAPDSLTATVDVFHVNLVVTAASPGVGQMLLFEASDDGGDTWTPVRGAEAVPLEATTYAVDWDIPFGTPRSYRARTFYDVPRTISDPSPERTVTCERYTYALTSVEDPTLGGEFAVTSLQWSRGRSVGVFDVLAGEDTVTYPIVITDGHVRARRGTISIETWDRAEYARLVGVLSPSGTLLIRDQFGVAVYCKIVGDWTESLLQAAPTLDEETGLRHAYLHDLPLVEIAAPVPVPDEG